jgi:hypothetical protein
VDELGLGTLTSVDACGEHAALCRGMSKEKVELWSV